VFVFQQMVSGPMAAGMLADQGADVIKVEPPKGGDQVLMY
jgi:crotonobetainyl-CoA:carnitine CoA-transferase CaiB-like acyl-CoA transferase